MVVPSVRLCKSKREISSVQRVVVNFSKCLYFFNTKQAVTRTFYLGVYQKMSEFQVFKNVLLFSNQIKMPGGGFGLQPPTCTYFIHGGAFNIMQAQFCKQKVKEKMVQTKGVWYEHNVVIRALRKKVHSLQLFDFK